MDEYKAYEDKLEDYRKSWESEHPGKPFNLEDPTHDEWQEANAPAGIDEDIVRQAETGVISERRIQQMLQEQRAEMMRGPIQHLATESAAAGEKHLLTAVAGKPVESFEQLREMDPEVAYLVQPTLRAARTAAAAVAELLTPGSPIQPDPKNSGHAMVMGRVQHYETEILRLPPEQRLDANGRPYVPGDVYERLSPREQARCWTFRRAPDEMAALVLRDLQVEANAAIQDHKAWKAKRGAAPAAAPAATPAAAPPPPMPAAPAPTPVPSYIRPPSGGTGPVGGPSTARSGPAGPARSFFDE